MALALGVAAWATLGCRNAIPPVPVPAPAAPPAGELRVRLVFRADADLDLYVTGPRRETVYFANSPSAIGGALDRDARCDDASELRAETVSFPAAPPGRYRIGVDFPERCRLSTRSAAYSIVVDAAGVHRELSGEIAFGVFEPVVLEFDYP